MDYDYDDDNDVDAGGDDGGVVVPEVPEVGGDEEPNYKSVVLFDDTTDEEEEEQDQKQTKKKGKKEKTKEKTPEEKKREEKQKKAKERRVSKRAACPLTCERIKVINSVRYWDEFVLQEYEATDVRGATIVSGFYSESIAAGFAAQFIIDELGLPLIGTMFAERGMPICVVKMNQPTDIVRIYGNRSIVVFTSQKILGTDMSNAVAFAIYDYAKRHHCNQIIALEAFPKELTVKVDEPDEKAIVEMLKKNAKNDKTQFVRFLTNDAETASKLKAGGHKQIRGALMTGVTGGIVSRAATAEQNVVSLICPYNRLTGQSRATLLLVKLVSEFVNIKVDTSMLEDMAEELESEVLKEFDKATSAKPVKHPSMYI